LKVQLEIPTEVKDFDPKVVLIESHYDDENELETQNFYKSFDTILRFAKEFRPYDTSVAKICKTEKEILQDRLDEAAK